MNKSNMHKNPYTLRQKSKGFTLVEVIIIVVVIAILATLGVLAYDRVLASATDSQRETKVLAIVEALEKYFQKNGEYPTCAQLSGTPDSVVALLPTLSKDMLVAPDAPSGTVNSITCGDLTDANGTDLFAFQGNVEGWTLKYKVAETKVVESISSRGQYVAGLPPSTTPTDPDPDPGPGPGGPSGVLLDCPAGYITVPGNATFGTSNFCVMKYEAKNVGGAAKSQAATTPWVSITRPNAVIAAEAACTGCHLITDEEWMTIAANVISVPSNWTGGAVGSGSLYTGHSDSAPSSRQVASTDDANGYYLTGDTSGTQRRTFTLTNGEVIWDIAGNVAEYTTGSLTGSGTYPGISGQSGFQYYEWNNPSLVFRGVPTTSLPTAAHPSASTWTSAHGIGRLYTSYNGSNASVFLRGGSYLAGTAGMLSMANDAGILSLYLGFNSGGSSASNIGFRVAVTP